MTKRPSMVLLQRISRKWQVMWANADDSGLYDWILVAVLLALILLVRMT